MTLSFYGCKNKTGVANINIPGNATCEHCNGEHISYEAIMDQIVPLYKKRIILSDFHASMSALNNEGQPLSPALIPKTALSQTLAECSNYPKDMDLLWTIKKHVPYVKVSQMFHTKSVRKLCILIAALYVIQLALTIYQFVITNILKTEHLAFLIQSVISVIACILLLAVIFVILLHFYAKKHGRKSSQVGLTYFLFLYDDYQYKDRYLIKLSTAETERIAHWSQMIPSNKYLQIALGFVAFIIVMVNIIYVPVFMLLYTISSLRIHDGQWVLPEMYDIQENLTYLIMNPILNDPYVQKIDKLLNLNLEKVIYHILNDTVLQLIGHDNTCTDLNYVECINKHPNNVMDNCEHSFDLKEFCFNHYDAFCDRNNSRVSQPFYFVTIWDENFGVLVLYLTAMFSRYWNFHYDINGVGIYSIYLTIIIDLIVSVFIAYQIYVYYDYYNTFFDKKTKGIKFWLNEKLLIGLERTSLDMHSITAASLDNIIRFLNDRICYEMIQFFLVQQHDLNYQIPYNIVGIIVEYIFGDFGEQHSSVDYYYNKENHLEMLNILTEQITKYLCTPMKQYCEIINI